MTRLSRRDVLRMIALTTGTVTAGAVAGCAGVGGGAEPAGGTLRYALWGGNARQQSYDKALRKIMDTFPDIKIEMEFAEYTAFQERMTTQIAARNVADIFWVPSAQVMTYYANGLYRQLDDIETFDLDDYDDAALQSFKLDGKLNAMPFGIFVPVLRYNATFAEEDGIELPEDGPGWTWDSLAELAIDYAKENKNRRKAITYGPDHDLSFEAWLRQHGEQLWTQDGRIGFTVDGLAGWLDWWEKLRKAGATPSISEQDGVGPDWSIVGKFVLMHFGNSNHIIDDAKTYPDHKFLLRNPPVVPGAPEGHQYLYFPRIAVYSGISDDNLLAAGEVINYCTNNVEMLKTVGLTMGAPVNPRVTEEIQPTATEDEKEMLRIVEPVRTMERKPRYEAPPGSNNWRVVMTRICEQVALGKTSPKDAAAGMIAEVEESINRAA